MATSRKPARSTSTKPAPSAKHAAKPVASKPVAAKPAAKSVAAKPVSAKPATKTVAAPHPPKPAGPAKATIAASVATFDKDFLDGIRSALLQRRASINNVVRSGRDQLASNEGDPSDIADRASDGFEDELTAGLLSIEAAQLDEVEAALARLDSGVYGACATCGKAIPRKRLEILPFAKRCLKCEGDKERSIPYGESDSESSEEEEEEVEAD